MKKRILLVDDEQMILEATKWAFEAQGYEVFTSPTAEEGLVCFQETKPDILLVDYKLPGMSGTDLLKQVKVLDPNVRAIMITGLTHQSEEIESECRKLGAYAFLHKPLKTEEVLEMVGTALKDRTTTR